MEHRLYAGLRNLPRARKIGPTNSRAPPARSDTAPPRASVRISLVYGVRSWMDRKWQGFGTKRFNILTITIRAWVHGRGPSLKWFGREHASLARERLSPSMENRSLSRDIFHPWTRKMWRETWRKWGALEMMNSHWPMTHVGVGFMLVSFECGNRCVFFASFAFCYTGLSAWNKFQYLKKHHYVYIRPKRSTLLYFQVCFNISFSFCYVLGHPSNNLKANI